MSCDYSLFALEAEVLGMKVRSLTNAAFERAEAEVLRSQLDAIGDQLVKVRRLVPRQRKPSQ